MAPPHTTLASHPPIRFEDAIRTSMMNGSKSLKSDTTLASAYDSLGIPVFVVDISGAITEWNSKLEEISGFDRKEVCNLNASELIVAEHQKSLWVEALRECARSGSGPSGFILHFKRNELDSFSVVVIRTAAQYNENSRGREVAAIVCFLDLIRVEKSSEQATQSTRPVTQIRLPLHLGHNQMQPLFVMDSNGIVCFWNKAMSELTGYTLDQIREPATFNQMFSNRDCDVVKNLMVSSLAGEESRCKVWLQHSDGRVLCVELCTVAQANEQNVNVAVVIIASVHPTTTASLAAEQIVSDVDIPIIGLNRDGSIDFWNPKACTTSGYSVTEATGKNFAETLLSSSLQMSVGDVIQSALAGKATPNMELELKSKSGETLYLLANFSSRRNQSGEIDGVLIAAQDVTEAAQHDRAVAAMARELRQLFDTANAPIFGVDVSGHINEWNDKMVEITGFTGDEAFNKSFVDTFISIHQADSAKNVIDSALIGRGTTNYELEIRTLSNETRYLLVNATTRRDADNNIVGMVGIAQDVTEAAKHDRAVAAMASELRQLIDTANAPIFGIDCDGYALMVVCCY